MSFFEHRSQRGSPMPHFRFALTHSAHDLRRGLGHSAISYQKLTLLRRYCRQPSQQSFGGRHAEHGVVIDLRTWEGGWSIGLMEDLSARCYRNGTRLRRGVRNSARKTRRLAIYNLARCVFVLRTAPQSAKRTFCKRLYMWFRSC
jgi:hypothetical protein